jgi:hypothetical protein
MGRRVCPADTSSSVRCSGPAIGREASWAYPWGLRVVSPEPVSPVEDGTGRSRIRALECCRQPRSTHSRMAVSTEEISESHKRSRRYGHWRMKNPRWLGRVFQRKRNEFNTRARAHSVNIAALSQCRLPIDQSPWPHTGHHRVVGGRLAGVTAILSQMVWGLACSQVAKWFAQILQERRHPAKKQS